MDQQVLAAEWFWRVATWALWLVFTVYFVFIGIEVYGGITEWWRQLRARRRRRRVAQASVSETTRLGAAYRTGSREDASDALSQMRVVRPGVLRVGPAKHSVMKGR